MIDVAAVDELCKRSCRCIVAVRNIVQFEQTRRDRGVAARETFSQICREHVAASRQVERSRELRVKIGYLSRVDRRREVARAVGTLQAFVESGQRVLHPCPRVSFLDRGCTAPATAHDLPLQILVYYRVPM